MKKTNILAILSLVFSIISIPFSCLCGIGGIFGVAAIILGIIALIKNSKKIMSIIGIILGFLGVVLSIMLLCIYAIGASSSGTENSVTSEVLIDESVEQQEVIIKEIVVEDVRMISIDEATAKLEAIGAKNISSNKDNYEGWDSSRLIVVEQNYEPGAIIKENEEIKLECKRMCQVCFDIESEGNLIFNTYDMNVVFNDTNIGSVENGKHLTNTVEILEGKYKLVVSRDDDEKKKDSEKINVNGDITVTCVVSHGKKVKIKTIEVSEGITVFDKETEEIEDNEGSDDEFVVERQESIYSELSDEEFIRLCEIMVKSFYTFSVDDNDFEYLSEHDNVMECLESLFNYAYENYYELDPLFINNFGFRDDIVNKISNSELLQERFELKYHSINDYWEIASYSVNPEDVIVVDGIQYIDANGYVGIGVNLYWIEEEKMEFAGTIEDIQEDVLIEKIHSDLGYLVDFEDELTVWKDATEMMTLNKKLCGKPLYYIKLTDPNRSIICQPLYYEE